MIIIMIAIMVVILLTKRVKKANDVKTYYIPLIIHITHSLTSVCVL